MRDVVLPACLAVGRPIVFSVAIMLLSFLPVFALGGIEGKMFHPLAFTKSFALLAVAVLAITLVPALCSLLIRGRLRSEMENPLVRGVIEVYRPVLSYLMDQPGGAGLGARRDVPAGLRAAGQPAALPGDRSSWRWSATALLARGRWVPDRWRRRACLLVALVADQTMTAAGARVHDAARRGDGDGHADHRPPGLGDASRSTT